VFRSPITDRRHSIRYWHRNAHQRMKLILFWWMWKCLFSMYNWIHSFWLMISGTAGNPTFEGSGGKGRYSDPYSCHRGTFPPLDFETQPSFRYRRMHEMNRRRGCLTPAQMDILRSHSNYPNLLPNWGNSRQSRRRCKTWSWKADEHFYEWVQNLLFRES